MIVNYFEPALNFELTPQASLDYFNGKGLQTTWNWYEMLGQQHDAAFTVAKMMDTDLLSDVQNAVTSAIENGTTLQQFKEDLIPLLQKKGWWGKQLSANGNFVQLGSASRLETIFRTNLQAAYAAGQWIAITEQADTAPFLMYDAVDDGRTREEHAHYDNAVFPVDHDFWTTHYPPNGYNCRCGVIQMDADEVEENGLKIGKKAAPPKSWTNPLTGKTHKIPFGVDPGFDNNPGINHLSKLKQLQGDKLAKLSPEQAAAAKKGIMATDALAKQKKAAQEALQAEKAAKLAVQKAQELQVAKEQLALIAQGKASTQASIKKKLFDKFSKDGTASGFGNDIPSLIKKIELDASVIQQKNAASSALSAYKKKVIAGKLPTKKQQDVFDSLDSASKQKVLADIDKKKAAAAAAQDTSPSSAINMANMKQIGGQKGSNPGGLYYDETTGKQWYIKEAQSNLQAHNEVLAAKLYEAAGIDVPNIQLIPGKPPRIASEIVDGLVRDASALKSGNLNGIYDGFATDAWLANWDVVGLTYDNMLVKGGKVIRLDTGGALFYRAQGGKKGAAFGAQVTELKTLIDPDINPQSAAVFGKMTKSEIQASVAKLAKVSDDKIRDVVNMNWTGTLSERKRVAELLIARKNSIIQQFPASNPIAEAAKKQAIRDAQFEVKSAISDIDSAVVTAIKGIAMRASKGLPLEAKDLERVATAKKLIAELKAQSKFPLSGAMRTNLDDYYSDVLDSLDDAISPGVGSTATWSGGQFNGYANILADADVLIDEDNIRYVIPDPNAAQVTSAKKAKQIIKDSLGDFASNSSFPESGRTHSSFKRLHDEHKRAIYNYTLHHYRSVNETLRTRSVDPRTAAYRDLLNEALGMSTPYVGKSARGISLSGSDLQRFIEGHRTAYSTGAPVRYNAFTSSSYGTNPAFGGNVKLYFSSKTAVNVKPLSGHKSENEVLFRAGTMFVVDDIQQSGSNYRIYLTEINSGFNDAAPLEFYELSP